MIITTNIIMDLGPCKKWPRDRVEKEIEKATRALGRVPTAVDSMRYENIDILDRGWLGISLLDTAQRPFFACDCAEHALTRQRDRGRTTDPRSWAAVEVARRYARGEATVDDLNAAADAAYAAVRSAEEKSTKEAARAAFFASYHRASDASLSAIWAATWDTSGTSEREWQIEQLVEYLSE
jgi:hypothetical protein